MSYMQDYEDYNSNSQKIPYDDIPISRRSQKGRKPLSASFSGFKTLVIMIAILFVSNIALLITSIYYLNNGIVREVHYHKNDITATGNVSAIATATAQWSSVCIAAGGTCYDEYTFFNATHSNGSGVILDIDTKKNIAYFLTCYHVIDGYENKVYVMLPSMLIPVQVQVVGYSSYYDIAVLKVEDIDKYYECTEVQVYDSSYISLGEPVFAVGNSLSGGTSVTEGVISRVNTLVKVEGNSHYSREIQTSAAINPGNSGGGLFNSEGKLVGIINAKLHTVKVNNTNLTVSGTAFAIPSTLAVGIANSIINNDGSPTAVSLGVTFENNAKLGKSPAYVDYNGETKEIEQYYPEVASVKSGSISSGSLQEGDIIKSFKYTNRNGVTQTKVMYNIYSFEDISFDIKHNTQIVFYIQRATISGFRDVEVTINASSYSTY